MILRMINSESVIMTDFFMVKYYVKEINYFNLTRNEYDNFINLLYGFVKEISYYNRLKAVLQLHVKNVNIILIFLQPVSFSYTVLE